MKHSYMKRIIYIILIGSILLSVSCINRVEVEISPTIPVVNISEPDLVFSDTGTKSSSFTITSDAPWTISFSDTKSTPAWCKVEPKNGNAGTTNVVVTINQDNDSYDDRSTNIKIVSGQTEKIVTVTQKKKNAIILSNKKFEVWSGRSIIQVDLKTNVDYSVHIPEEYVSWILQGEPSNTKSLQDKSEVFTIEEGSTEGARKGLIIFSSGELKDTVTVFQAQKKAPIDDSDKPYESTDFSRDGEVLRLQQASAGNRINIVIIGDGFIDKDMGRGGKYEEKAIEAMENFFGKEPLKSFRNRFNVYCVKAVSLNEGIGEENNTAFSAKYGEGTSISGDNKKCFEYVLKVPAIDDISNVTVINILNDSKHAGTCWMYSNNASIAYCPLIAFNPEKFAQIVHHEAVGHGFGKLADEYSYTGRIPQSRIDYYKQWDDIDSSWWGNIDFTDNPLEIKWRNFLTNPLYATTVGIYEGGASYEYGVYRPTENSIMRYNIGEFNAPSRLAIYQRIILLSGEEYNYDVFLEYDHINRTSTRSVYTIPENFTPFSPPVVVR